ncbi:hypothetical protein [Gloeobacter violaceus]|uniref:Gll3901 protein n=1 Tax=Gloeobacter violaceus (strain ATCC 29082 / PCC 7421) TaxID=251221 RepID=Q7NEH8_GLOVI|nr:hypothetical protein [Gloeobacter violaceus]BAC91842.1 gll3901 [Gloeobacter violaceus PCC 7421]
MFWTTASLIISAVVIAAAWRRYSGAPALIWGMIVGLGTALALGMLLPGMITGLIVSTTVALLGGYVLAEWFGLFGPEVLEAIQPAMCGALIGLGVAALSGMIGMP